MAIDAALLQPCALPPAPEHPDQRRRAALAIALLQMALYDCDKRIAAIRAQQERQINDK